MKKLIPFTFVLFLLIFNACEENSSKNPKPKELNATDGSAVGCIHIDFVKDENVESVILERREKGTTDWQVITGTSLTSFDENQGYPNTGMPPGKVFEYRIKNDWPDDAEYSEIEEGYAYDIIPVTEIKITSTETSNTLIWNEQNNGSFINESEIFFEIYRSEDSLGVYEKVATVGEDRSYFDNFSNQPELQGKKFYYRVDVFFSFGLNLPSGGSHWESTTPIEGTVVGSSIENGENPTVNYITTDLGQILASSGGAIIDIKEKVIDNTVYLGVITDATLYGKPALYSLNNSSWQSVWSSVPDVEFDEINFAISGNNSYIAGNSNDSLCVYNWDGSSWSSNLTPDNLGKDESPSSMSIESYNDELYMAITQHPDYNLQVLKYNGSEWDHIGGDANGDVATGNIYDIEVENINGTLYMYYRIDDIFYIKHLNGTTWTTNLEWNQEWLGGIELVKNGSDLYFSSNTRSSSYNGGVYHVTSTTTVENLIPNESDWFTSGAFALSIDSDGNLIVASMQMESAELIYPYLNIYDGTEWKTITGEFSDGMTPVSISTIGTDIYYTYGDASTENASGDPTAIKSKKFTK